MLFLYNVRELILLPSPKTHLKNPNCYISTVRSQFLGEDNVKVRYSSMYFIIYRVLFKNTKIKDGCTFRILQCEKIFKKEAQVHNYSFISGSLVNNVNKNKRRWISFFPRRQHFLELYILFRDNIAFLQTYLLNFLQHFLLGRSKHRTYTSWNLF